MHKLSNISLRLFRKFLKSEGFTAIRTKGGHEHWSRPDLNRDFPIQTHIDPVPEFIVHNLLRVIDMSRKEFLEKITKL